MTSDTIIAQTWQLGRSLVMRRWGAGGSRKLLAVRLRVSLAGEVKALIYTFRILFEY